MFYIDLDMEPLEEYARSLGTLAEKQLPFAAATALNELAVDGKADVERGIKRNFDEPTRFTKNSVAVLYAKKNQLHSTVLIKDQQAKYLGITETGGTRKPGDYATGRKAVLEPADIKLNRYGNLPKRRLKSLQNRKDVFTGPVRFKQSGKTVAGVWQRPKRSRKFARRDDTTGTVGNTQRKVGGARTGLKLLLRFVEEQKVKPRLNFGSALERRAELSFDRAIERAFRKAIATAKV